MADGNGVPAAPAADGKLDGKPGEPLKDNPDAGHVTKAEFTALSRTLMSEITSLKSMLPPPKADAKPKTDDAPTLTGQAEELRTLKEGLKAGSKRTAVTAAVANKLGARTDAFAKYVLALHGDKIEVSEDFQRVEVNDNGTRQPVAKWLDAFLQTDDGLAFMPPPAQPPSGDGLTGSHAGMAKPKHRFSDMGYEEIQKASKSAPHEFRTYIAEHRDEYEAKKKRALSVK